MAKSSATDPRSLAVAVLQTVLDDGRSLSVALAAQSIRCSGQGRALLQELCYGVLRWFGLLDAIVAGLLQKPFKSRDRDIHYLLLLGVYQLRELDIPAHAAVNETVNVARLLGKRWAAGLVNGVLRRYQREPRQIEARVLTDRWRVCAHPEWLYRRFEKDWPGRVDQITRANNIRPPMALRVNELRISRDRYLDLLTDSNMPAAALPCTDAGLVLEQATTVGNLPGFEDGLVSVQDGAAQLAAQLLVVADEMRVLDACAAPGGKTANILERAPQARLVAVDVEQARLDRVNETLRRLGLYADLCCADVADSDHWWNGEPFQRILLDAPCSATGVIRRHPDIKWLRRDSDINELVRLQARLLDALWPLLAPGGILLYATCSLLREENSMQIDRFLEKTPDARADDLALDCGCPDGHGRQFFPGEDSMDGFFYARLRKDALS